MTHLLDTDHLSLYQLGHPRVVQNLLQHLADQLAISVITVEEQLGGWQGGRCCRSLSRA